MNLSISGIEECYEHLEGTCNIMGNGNDLEFKNCQVLINLMGNSNTIIVADSQLQIEVNGNGNRLFFRCSSFSIGINGNNNQLEHIECSPTINHINGFGNETGNRESMPSNASSNFDLSMTSRKMKNKEGQQGFQNGAMNNQNCSAFQNITPQQPSQQSFSCNNNSFPYQNNYFCPPPNFTQYKPQYYNYSNPNYYPNYPHFSPGFSQYNSMGPPMGYMGNMGNMGPPMGSMSNMSNMSNMGSMGNQGPQRMGNKGNMGSMRNYIERGLNYGRNNPTNNRFQENTGFESLHLNPRGNNNGSRQYPRLNMLQRARSSSSDSDSSSDHSSRRYRRRRRLGSRSAIRINHNNPKLSQKEIQIFPVHKYIDNKELTCSICLENIAKGEQVMYLLCFHSFHSQCCKSWLLKQSKCPLCQVDLKKALKQTASLSSK